MLEKELDKQDHIHILVGMGVDDKTFDALKKYRRERIPDSELKNIAKSNISLEMGNSEDNAKVEKGVKNFLEGLVQVE